MKNQWFDSSDSMQTVKEHIGGKHIPDSVRDDAMREYIARRLEDGALPHDIKEEIFEMED